MKKIEIFVIEESESQIFCIYEETAKEQSFARSKNYLNTKVTKEVFENMLKEKAFFDTDLYLATQEPKKEETQLLETPTDTAKLLAIVEEMRARLENLEHENTQLKARPRLSIQQAKDLHDKRMTLISNKNIFEKAKSNINGALKEFENVIEFDENEAYRLVLIKLDYKTSNGKELFSITTNAVIDKTMKIVKNEIMNKVADIEFEINEIENTFI